MAYFTTARPVADGVFGRSFGFGIRDVFARLATWNDRRITRNELSKLSDRELDDIGLCRGDIEDAVARMR
jgi:uncharacterized protein YjiS (DUF1127 family)